MCQEIPKEKWMDRKREDLLPIPYHHVVFTLPHELNPLLYQNQKELYGLLFRAGSETLRELLENPKHGGGQSGFLCVLHTWGQTQNYHPHLHCIVMGGVLKKNGRFEVKDGAYLIPVKAASRLFRGKFLSAAKELAVGDKLRLWEKKEAVSYKIPGILQKAWKKEWIPHIKPAQSGSGRLLEYLGRYTHRISISNGRIRSMDEKTVVFQAKDYRDQSRVKEVQMGGEEFVRRFLMHVLPKGFTRLRAYGLMSNAGKKKLKACRRQIGGAEYRSLLRGKNTEEALKILYGKDVRACPCCKGNRWESRALAGHRIRAWPNRQ